MITHYMEEAALADRIIVLDDGSMLLDGTPSEVFEHEQTLKKCGLNVPQCTELIHRLRADGIDVSGDCVSLEQCISLVSSILAKEDQNV